MSHNEYAQQMAYDKEQEEKEKCDCGEELLICDSGMKLCSKGCKDYWVYSNGEKVEEEESQRWELIVTYLKKEWGEPPDEEWEEILGWAKDYDENTGISVDMMQKECRDKDLNDFITYKSNNYYSLKDFLGY